MQRVTCSDVWKHAGVTAECCPSCHGDDGGQTDSLDFEMTGVGGVAVYVEVCCAAYRAALEKWGESALTDGRSLPWVFE